MEKEYCMECLKENPPEREICECGGRNFTWGDDIKIINEKIVCKCGNNNNFKTKLHIDYISYANTYYTCMVCGNTIGVQIYKREKF